VRATFLSRSKNNSNLLFRQDGVENLMATLWLEKAETTMDSKDKWT
jgi:hypothetical protein